MITDKHLEFAQSDVERAAVQAYLDHGSGIKAAKALGKSKTSVNEALARVKRRASLQGFSPENDMHHIAPGTHFVKGTSTLYKDGEVALQWVKTDKKAEDQYAVMREAVQALKESIPKANKSKPNESITESDLANCYVITDYHMGMMAWGEETNSDDWDMDIAEEKLLQWFSQAIKQSPNAEVGILAQLGDFHHWDGMDAVTPTHGHLLDADTRFQKLIRTSIKCFVSIVDMMLKKHDKVHIIHATGNHDLASSAWFREMFAFYYSDDPRVTVDQSADCYYCYEHGETSLFFHHGHKRSGGSLSPVLAAKFRDVFGRTKYSYAHTGHKHSKDVKENGLMVVEQHQTLAAPDAYASAGGWISQRSAQSITYHKKYGEVSRIRVTPDMLK